MIAPPHALSPDRRRAGRRRRRHRHLPALPRPRGGLHACASSRRGDGVGGTWFWNRYPGARFDSESYTYGYLFSEELFDDWEWQEHFAGQPETERYLNHVVDRFDLRRHMRFGARVTSARAATSRRARGRSTPTTAPPPGPASWSTATGVLSVPYVPDIPGRDDFAGVQHHTGRWPAEPVDFAGKRVAVVGHLVQRRAGGAGGRRRGRRAHRVPAQRQLVHAAQQPADHRRGAGASCGPASRSCARC